MCLDGPCRRSLPQRIFDFKSATVWPKALAGRRKCPSARCQSYLRLAVGWG